MRTMIFTLLEPAGEQLDLFDLYSDADGYIVPFESGISREVLLLGYTSTVVPDTTTTVRIFSTGLCTNFVDEVVPTTTTTTTVAVVASVSLSASSYSSGFFACQSVVGTILRYYDGVGANPTIGDTIYTDEALTTVLVGGGVNDWWFNPAANLSYQIDSGGVVLADFTCEV